jgi:hypothetical protein
VPLTPRELRRYRDVFERLDFEQTWTPFEPARNCGRPEVLALLDQLMSGRSHAAPVPLGSLAIGPANRF